MNESPETRESLLYRIRDGNDAVAWHDFVRTYETLIYRVARRHGLQDSDAREVMQEVLVAVSKAIHRWEPTGQQGAFRSWLFRVTRNMTLNLLSKQQRQLRGSGDTDVLRLLEDAPDPSDSDFTLFQAEYRRQLFRSAAEVVRGTVQENTWLAFWKTCVEGDSIQRVATELGMSVGSVYAARSRVTARLAQQVQEMTWDE